MWSVEHAHLSMEATPLTLACLCKEEAREDFQLEASIVRVLLSGEVTRSSGARNTVSGRDAIYDGHPERD